MERACPRQFKVRSGSPRCVQGSAGAESGRGGAGALSACDGEALGGRSRRGEARGRAASAVRRPAPGRGAAACGRRELRDAAPGAQGPGHAGCAMVQLTTLLCRAYHGGHLTIRLALGGCTNRPFYRIVAAHNKCPRDGRFVEQLGSYDPLPNSHGEKLVALNLERIRHWIGCGAHLSKPVEKLLGLSGFFPLHPMMITNAERLRRKRAREVLLATQKTDTEAIETKAI
ncbi:small ribosomal subunit protein bS16m [Diceros bicornis minor]|nr:small ribosomal subunit protein bS16m [Diceros bicornis minor]